MTITKKTKEQLDAEVPAGHKRLPKMTKVVALKQGYSDSIREPGDVFYVNEGTIMEPDCWFKPVGADTATSAEIDAIDDLSVPEIKVELAQKFGITDFKSNKKADLAAMLIKARQDDESLV